MDIPAGLVVAFYLVHSNARDPGCLPLKSDVLTRASVDGTTTPMDPESSSWRVTFDRNSTLAKPPCLISFVSDPRCTINLKGARHQAISLQDQCAA